MVSCSCFLMYLLFVCVELPDPVTFRAQTLRQLAVLILWSNSQGVPAWCTLHNNTTVSACKQVKNISAWCEEGAISEILTFPHQGREHTCTA